LSESSNHNGLQVDIGKGDISGTTPSFCLTYGNKVYVLEGSNVHFSDLGVPTSFNDINGVGNGFVNMLNYYYTQESLQAVAPYQGRLVFVSRQTTQIWQVSADPNQWQQVQVMPNIGTMAPESVKPVGELDVMMLSDSGIRSIRVRDQS